MCPGPQGQEGSRIKLAGLPSLESPAYSNPLVRLPGAGSGVWRRISSLNEVLID